MPERLFSAHQVSDLLGVSLAEVAQWIHRGQLSFQRMPDGSMRVRQKDLMEFLRKQGIDIDAILANAMEADNVRSGDTVLASVGLPDSPAPMATVNTAPAMPAWKNQSPLPDDRPARPDEPTHSPQSLAAEMHALTRPASRVDFSALEVPSLEPPVVPTTPAPSPSPAAPTADETPTGEIDSAGSAGQIVDAMLRYAIAHRAQQILLEDSGTEMSVRFRLDGQLHRKALGSRLVGQLAQAVASHVYKLAGLDESKRASQRGVLTFESGGAASQFKIVTCPTLSGARVSIEPIMPVQRMDLGAIGMAEHDRQRLTAMLNRTAGMILVAGRPRSGMGTTLDALTTNLACAGRDVVEISRRHGAALPGVSQLPVGSEGPMGFAQGIEAAVAQQADVLVLHDLRDRASVRLAWHSACEDRLVLASLRAGSWADAMGLLVQAGADAWELANVLQAVVCPQAPRRLCPNCRSESTPSQAALASLGLEQVKLGFTTYTSAGCPKCARTGFDGRTGIFSILCMDDALASLLRQGADTAAIEQAAGRAGMRTLVQAGMEKVRQGELSIDELARILGAGA